MRRSCVRAAMAAAATVVDSCGGVRGETRWLTGSRREVAACSGRLGRGLVGQGFFYFVLFPLFLFILSYFILVTFYFSFSKNYH